ncbi:hypothetical protein PF007_g2115 [Phytophthora fragariae]|uniref:Secreted protein n=1 Tax=Phytophthora fragariae TaxID=53985 RepID=A0A6A3THA9_9STRA|nr:hypothetical protein PF007_g2115 [Phytophthora fragariae]
MDCFKNGGTLGTSISWLRIITMTLVSSSVRSQSCVVGSAGLKHNSLSLVRSCTSPASSFPPPSSATAALYELLCAVRSFVSNSLSSSLRSNLKNCSRSSTSLCPESPCRTHCTMSWCKRPLCSCLSRCHTLLRPAYFSCRLGGASSFQALRNSSVVASFRSRIVSDRSYALKRRSRARSLNLSTVWMT